MPVSYTHLDVYKRQPVDYALILGGKVYNNLILFVLQTCNFRLDTCLRRFCLSLTSISVVVIFLNVSTLQVILIILRYKNLFWILYIQFRLTVKVVPPDLVTFLTVLGKFCYSIFNLSLIHISRPCLITILIS